MKQTITINDLDKIVGRFILQLNTDDPIELTNKKVDLDFYLTKRVRFVTGGRTKIILSDFWGNTMEYTGEQFVTVFNDYVGESTGKRYHRLLYTNELDIVFKFMKERNY